MFKKWIIGLGIGAYALSPISTLANNEAEAQQGASEVVVAAQNNQDQEISFSSTSVVQEVMDGFGFASSDLEKIMDFSHLFGAVWNDAQLNDLHKVIDRIELYGINEVPFLAAKQAIKDQRIIGSDKSTIATATLMKLLKINMMGQVDPKTLSIQFHMKQDSFDIEHYLAELGKGVSVSHLWQQTMPQYALYQKAAQKLQQVLHDPDHYEPVIIPNGKSIKLGMKGERVRLLRKRLGVLPGERTIIIEPMDPAAPISPDSLSDQPSLDVENHNNQQKTKDGDHAHDRVSVLAGPNVTVVKHTTNDESTGRLPVSKVEIYDDEFDQELLNAVKDFQVQNGLKPDGIVGSGTRQVLNSSQSDPKPALRATLEMLRLMQNDLGRQYILVNIPSYHLDVMHQDKVHASMKVIVGKKSRQTPLLSSYIKNLVLNPFWYVPNRIATSDILPKFRNDPGYLSRNGYRLYGHGGGRVDAQNVNWSEYGRGHFPFRITQNPGRGNALGKVKFNIPNDFAIFLHDTSKPYLFKKSMRALSSGCIRLEDPDQMIKIALAGGDEYTGEEVDAMLENPRHRKIPVINDYLVYITYLPAYLDMNGDVAFAGDIYGRAKKINGAIDRLGK